MCGATNHVVIVGQGVMTHAVGNLFLTHAIHRCWSLYLFISPLGQVRVSDENVVKVLLIPDSGDRFGASLISGKWIYSVEYIGINRKTRYNVVTRT